MNFLVATGVLVTLVVPAILADATSNLTIPVIAQYGLLGPVLGALWWAYRREAARGDRLESKLLEAIPTISLATTAVSESNLLLREVAVALEITAKRR